uniref:Protein phosphatase 1 regulatory subunit 21 n=1 Tax=Callorhinchus milii TaxID=7868 RepID=A0A4W3GS87_CALMI
MVRVRGGKGGSEEGVESRGGELKARSKRKVLRPALKEEREEAVKEELKMKDQSVRKLQQEMDSLTFRNQQLAKRVELLQEELVNSETKGKKNKKSNDSPSQLRQQRQSVFDEDLQNKIEENERLHKQVHEAHEQHGQIETDLRGRLAVLEKETAQHQAVVEGLNQKYMDMIEKLQNDKANLEVKSQSLEREAKECRLRAEECQQQLKNTYDDLSSRLDQSASVIQEKVSFNDTRFTQYNTLNVPVHDRRHQLKARDVASQALAFLRDLVGALLNLHTYMEQRVQIYPIDSATDTVSSLNQKFSEYLHENASYVRPLEDGMLHLYESITEETVTSLETAVKLKPFSENLNAYVCFLKKILPYQLKSLEEECESPLCTAHLQARNLELQSDMKQLTAVFEKLQVYISLLALPSTKPEMLLQTNHNIVFTQLAACLHSLHDVTKDILKHYNQKASLEQELPTVTQKLKTTNDCILSSIVALSNVSGKPCPESVPYKEALVNRKVLLSSTESREGLSQQVIQSQEKIAKLEQEKEHWMLETQLAKIKLEKENQRIADLEVQLKTTFPGHMPLVDSNQEEDSALNLETGILHEDSREYLIKSHYMTRVAELTSQLQVADSKSVHFYSECRALAKRLTLGEKSRETLSEEVKVATQNVVRLQDELTTTKRSYEDQLSMMSDHLCRMNETLSKQREEIDTLRMGNKVNRCNKNNTHIQSDYSALF